MALSKMGNYKLRHSESYGGRFFDYFRTTIEFEREVLEAIETALDDELLGRKIDGELIDLKKSVQERKGNHVINV